MCNLCLTSVFGVCYHLLKQGKHPKENEMETLKPIAMTYVVGCGRVELLKIFKKDKRVLIRMGNSGISVTMKYKIECDANGDEFFNAYGKDIYIKEMMLP